MTFRPPARGAYALERERSGITGRVRNFRKKALIFQKHWPIAYGSGFMEEKDGRIFLRMEKGLNESL